MDYKNLSDSSKVWIYQSNRALSSTEVEQMKELGDVFVQRWAAHGAQLKAAYEIFHNRFIVLFADESQTSASGCSIDSSVHFIKQLEKQFNLDLFDRMNIAYEDGDNIKTVKMNEFEQKLQAGEIAENTIVFNNLVQSLGEFKTKWKIPVKDSWHSRMMA